MHPAMKKRTSFAKAPDFSAKRDTESVLKGEKKVPTEVDYRQAPVDSKERCHECSFYNKPGSSESDCAKVVGVVRAEGVCDLFRLRAVGETPHTGSQGSGTSFAVTVEVNNGG